MDGWMGGWSSRERGGLRLFQNAQSDGVVGGWYLG